MDKRKLEADKKLIIVLFGIEPLDWLRKDNGDLVYLNQAGQKFTLTPDEINKLSDKVLAEQGRSTAQGRSAEIPQPAGIEPAEVLGIKKAKPAPTPKIRSTAQERSAEIPHPAGIQPAEMLGQTDPEEKEVQKSD